MRWLLQHRYYKLIISLIIAALSIAACGTSNEPDVQILPTVAVLPSATDTLIPTEQPTLPPTWTPTSTETQTPSPTVTLTLTVTPSQTITDTPTMTFTPSITPSQIPRPIVDLIQLAYQATILPQDYAVPDRDGIEVTLPPTTPQDETLGDDSFGGSGGGAVLLTTPLPGADVAVDCPFYPVGGFATAYTSNGTTAQLLGCPTGNPPITFQINSVYQVFERGIMIWLEGSPNEIYALYNDGTYQQFADTFNEAVDPETGGETPPNGMLEPRRGFGKVWRTFSSVKSNLGWALSGEISGFSTIQDFVRGKMIYIPVRGDVLGVVTNPDGGTGTWIALPGEF